MGIFASFLADAKSIDITGDKTPLDRAIHRDIQPIIAAGDVDAPAGFGAVNEVQTLIASTATAGTFDLSIGFSTPLGDVFVLVEDIAFDAAPAAIEAAIDAAVTAAGTVPGWADGDIAVSGAGTAEANDTVLTYSGDSVAGRAQPLSTVDGANLTAGGAEDIEETTPGQNVRAPWAVFSKYSIMTFGGTPPAQVGGSIPTLVSTIDRSRVTFSDATLRALAREAELQDKIVGLEAALLAAMNLNPNPPASSQG